MRRRQIIAHHLILPLYGHWAPNDPRGSGSTEFFNENLEILGPIHVGRKPQHLQPTREELRAFHRQFKSMLKHEVFWIDDAKRQSIADAFGSTIRERGYTCYACAICANHAHLLIRIHRDDALTTWKCFAEASRLRLRTLADVGTAHPVWADRPYVVYLYAPPEVHGRMEYVEINPLKEGLSSQRWPFVKPYDNWPLHKQR
jgi:hypothetical protein